MRPLVEYEIVVFSPSKCKTIKKIERVQNNFTRKLMIRALGFVYDKIPSARQRSVNFHIPSLALRRRFFDLTTFHKIVHGRIGVTRDSFNEAIVHPWRFLQTGFTYGQTKV